jgi:glycosyltransferase involved in cell wall biosynthesis
VHGYQLASGLSSKGFELLVFARQTDPPSPEIERVGKIEIRRILPKGRLKGKGWKALGPLLLFLTKLLLLLIRHSRSYDIILSFGIKILPIPALLLKLGARKICVIRAESPMELREDISEESLRKMSLSRVAKFLRIFQWARNWAIRQSDCFVAISSEIRQDLLDLGWNPGKIRSIPNGIDADLFFPVSSDEKSLLRQRLDLPANKSLFVFTGRLAKSKGVLMLIQVWAELVRKYPDIHLVLVGSGSGVLSFDGCEEELITYVKDHHLEESVSLTGQVDNVQTYLQASDVFVFPSEYEGFGLVIVEALACGLPAVVTRVGVAREHIQDYDNGMLVEPKDRAGLLRAMEWLLNHKELWPRMGMNARDGIKDKYSTAVEAEMYSKMFVELGQAKGQRMSKHPFRVAAKGTDENSQAMDNKRTES